MPTDAGSTTGPAPGPGPDAPIVHDKPPFFRSWAGVYALVLGAEAALIALFYLVTVTFR